MSALDEQWAAAMRRYEAAIVEFQSATAVVIDSLKAGRTITQIDVEREQQARAEVVDARQAVVRLGRLKNLIG
jgi:hypothetical protein